MIFRGWLVACALSAMASGAAFEAKLDRSGLVIGHDCGMTTPCNARMGSIVHRFTERAVAAIEAGSGTAYVYIAASGVLTVGHSGLRIRCERCAVAEGLKGFPVDCLPLWTWTAHGGKWDPAGVDQRASVARELVTAGGGLMASENGGLTVLGMNPAVVPMRVSVPRTASETCTEGSWAADREHFYLCIGPGSWRRAALAAW